MNGGPARAAPDCDLDSPREIAEMVRRFYQDVAQDDLLGPVFVEVAQVDWNEHLPKLTAFWCRALLSQPGYAGNPLREHERISRRSPFTHEQFDRWLQLFHDTVELGWVGPKAARALDFAETVARVHRARLVDGNDEPSAPALGIAPSAAGRRR